MVTKPFSCQDYGDTCGRCSSSQHYAAPASGPFFCRLHLGLPRCPSVRSRSYLEKQLARLCSHGPRSQIWGSRELRGQSGLDSVSKTALLHHFSFLSPSQKMKLELFPLRTWKNVAFMFDHGQTSCLNHPGKGHLNIGDSTGFFFPPFPPPPPPSQASRLPSLLHSVLRGTPALFSSSNPPPVCLCHQPLWLTILFRWPARGQIFLRVLSGALGLAPGEQQREPKSDSVAGSRLAFGGWHCRWFYLEYPQIPNSVPSTKPASVQTLWVTETQLASLGKNEEFPDSCNTKKETGWNQASEVTWTLSTFHLYISLGVIVILPDK